MKILIMVLGFLFAMLPTAEAAIYQQGVIYVIYDEEGAAAPKSKTDINANGVPDVVEDIATQINAARELFKDVFNYPDPLGSERYKNVTSIEVDIGAKEVMKNNGYAFSAVRKNSKHNPKERALQIQVANTINPHKNSTPAHEYFHLIQHGVTRCRGTWYSEGMAKWSQDSVTEIKKYPDGKNIPTLLKSKTFEQEVFKVSYDASNLLWYPLAVNMNDKAKIPSSLMKKYKYVDGAPVFQDNIIYGANVMREVLKSFKAREALLTKEFGSWDEWIKNRNDERSYKIMFDGVKEIQAKGKI